MADYSDFFNDIDLFTSSNQNQNISNLINFNISSLVYSLVFFTDGLNTNENSTNSLQLNFTDEFSFDFLNQDFVLIPQNLNSNENSKIIMTQYHTLFLTFLNL